MGVAKAALEATVRYLAAIAGAQGNPRECHLRWPNQDARRTRHQRLRDDSGHGDSARTAARNVEQLEVGNVALFLASDLASAITGEITFVDCGFNITGI